MFGIGGIREREIENLFVWFEREKLNRDINVWDPWLIPIEN